MRIRNCVKVLIGFVFVCIFALPARADVVLTLQGSCPGPMRAVVTGAGPFRSVFLVFAQRTGNVRIPSGSCSGTVLGLGRRGIRFVAGVGSDSGGNATFEGFVPGGACGGYLQVYVTPGCQTSNVVEIN